MNRSVLSGTPRPVLSGTLFPYYREPEEHVTPWPKWRRRAPSNLPNRVSFGFLLTERAFHGSGTKRSEDACVFEVHRIQTLFIPRLASLRAAVVTSATPWPSRRREDVMIVALLTQEAAAGKTTLALRLNCEWVGAGRLCVVLIDADSQGSALDWSQKRARDRLPRLFGGVGLARSRLRGTASELARSCDHVVIDKPSSAAGLTLSALLPCDLAPNSGQPSPLDGCVSVEMLTLRQETRIDRPQLSARFASNRRDMAPSAHASWPQRSPSTALRCSPASSASAPLSPMPRATDDRSPGSARWFRSRGRERTAPETRLRLAAPQGRVLGAASRDASQTQQRCPSASPSP
ncbi:hypothetical protein MPC4_250020 [Methylocella tundrae]|uniref:CobQ/CobB/MinD/ParA nucleotide binding domain-containing protein n=1 Tax=Methylocella tundrae TaxID=227605 RepID=A0A8B6M8E0_METTU|nr:hypothetical protein MPC1_290009 [Methylocella tundrae]VTZ50512.1 hypothetical protein MPC4_250020 [Methylocella tundrae]